MNACIKYGWNETESKENPVVANPGVQLKYPEDGWISLIDALGPQSDFCPNFNMSHTVAYFVTRTVKDFLPAGDFKSVNKSAENLFRCGHVQNIQSVSVNNILYIKSTCLPEMQKDCVYCVQMALESSSSDITAAECGCPAGHGPNGSCRHIGALLYGLADFIRFKHHLNTKHALTNYSYGIIHVLARLSQFLMIS